MNPYLLYTLLSINIIAFAQAAIDKRAALKQKQRIPELQLIAPVLFGGFPGLLLGMLIFRHKTKKVSFQLKLTLAVLLFCGILYALFFRG